MQKKSILFSFLFSIDLQIDIIKKFCIRYFVSISHCVQYLLYSAHGIRLFHLSTFFCCCCNIGQPLSLTKDVRCCIECGQRVCNNFGSSEAHEHQIGFFFCQSSVCIIIELNFHSTTIEFRKWYFLRVFFIGPRSNANILYNYRKLLQRRNSIRCRLFRHQICVFVLLLMLIHEKKNIN